MPITRFSLRDCDFSSTQEFGGKSLTVQDLGTTTANAVARLANGVISADALQNGCTYLDFGLPANMDRFDLMELAKKNAAEIVRLQNEAENPPETPPAPETSPAPETPPA
jgi:hypothetical protein